MAKLQIRATACPLTKDECCLIPVVKTNKYNTKSIGTINFRVWNTYFTPLLRPSSSSLLQCWRQQDHGHSDILESYNDTLADNIAGEEGAAITKQNNRSSEHQASFHHQHLDSKMLGLVHFSFYINIGVIFKLDINSDLFNTNLLNIFRKSNKLEHVHLLMIELEHLNFGFERMDIKHRT